MTTQHFGRADRHVGVGIDQRRSGVFRGPRFAQRRLVAVGFGVAMMLPMAATIATPLASAATAISAHQVHAASVASHTATPKSASACSKVSAASVAAIVGQPAPAVPAVSFTKSIPATKQSSGVSGVETQCVYGNGTAGETFILGFTVTSKPLSIGLLKSKTTAAVPASEKVNFTSYSGLGVPGFRVTFVSGSVHTDEIGGISGNTEFSAAGPGSLSVSKLASLAKLAKGL
jgi:hypothetical protein